MIPKPPAQTYLLCSPTTPDHARIFVLDGPKTSGGFWGDLAILSSVGAFGHMFSNLHVPLKQYLLDTHPDTILSTLTTDRRSLIVLRPLWNMLLPLLLDELEAPACEPHPFTPSVRLPHQVPTFLLSGNDATANGLVELWVHLKLFLLHHRSDDSIDDVLTELHDSLVTILANYNIDTPTLIEDPSLPASLVQALRTARRMREWPTRRRAAS